LAGRLVPMRVHGPPRLGPVACWPVLPWSVPGLSCGLQLGGRSGAVTSCPVVPGSVGGAGGPLRRRRPSQSRRTTFPAAAGSCP